MVASDQSLHCLHTWIAIQSKLNNKNKYTIHLSLGLNDKWAVTRQNQQNECVPSEDSDVRMKTLWAFSYPLSAQWRLWLDWANAQADLSLPWVHSFCWFCQDWGSWLKWTHQIRKDESTMGKRCLMWQLITNDSTMIHETVSSVICTMFWKLSISSTTEVFNN